MTPKSQRIAIAEACGWVWYRMPTTLLANRLYRTLFLPDLHEYEGQSPRWTVRADMTENVCNMDYMAREGLVADYLNDLNAMHEAEKVLTPKQHDDYYEWLSREASRVTTVEEGIWLYRVRLISPPAAQRAEAFLRAIGKWEETQSPI